MVIGDDQKLGVILSDDDTGTAACGLLGLRSLGTVTEHAEVVLYFLYGLVCDGDDRPALRFSQFVETSIVPVEVELEDVAAAFKRRCWKSSAVQWLLLQWLSCFRQSG